MSRIGRTNDIGPAFSPHHLAIFTYPLNAGSNFHRTSPLKHQNGQTNCRSGSHGPLQRQFGRLVKNQGVYPGSPGFHKRHGRELWIPGTCGRFPPGKIRWDCRLPTIRDNSASPDDYQFSALNRGQRRRKSANPCRRRSSRRDNLSANFRKRSLE